MQRTEPTLPGTLKAGLSSLATLVKFQIRPDPLAR